MSEMLLVHSTAFPIDRYRQEIATGLLEPRVIDDFGELAEIESSIVLLDRRLCPDGSVDVLEGSGVAIISIGLAPDQIDPHIPIYLHLPDDPPSNILSSAVRGAKHFLEERLKTLELQRQLEEVTGELEEVNKIGMALSTERNYDVLIAMILSKSRELSRADAGSLYILDTMEDGEKVLRWKLAQNDSIDVDFEEQILPITKKSLAGYVALTGETLVIDDAYELNDDVEYSINRSFDSATGYRTKSIVVLPMRNHKGEMIGVVQLINRKRAGAHGRLTASNVEQNVIPFDERTNSVLRSLAGQAAVAVENNLLYDSIERLFEGFVTASVTAIEQRDPTTSGHSFRVADLTIEIAKVADRAADGPYRDVRFSSEQIREIRYASLLHDFGKVGVREQVLVKEKKLYPLQLDLIRSRFEFLMKATETATIRKKLDWLLSHRDEDLEVLLREMEEDLARELGRLDEEYRLVVQANEPTVLPEGDFQHLQQLATREYDDASGSRKRLLEPEEVKVLSIRKGSLDPGERLEIESHVTHTFEFLSKIPWTQDLVRIPDYAYAHHEKLNGRGYPRGLSSESIPLQSRMMTVSDIYDALTAQDRPYKRAIPTQRALDILGMEVKDGLLDSSVVDLFIEAEIFKRAGIYRP